MSSLVPLETLPLGIIRQILCLLPNIQSLLSTILTCRRVYNAFTTVDTTITTAVVSNFAQKLPEAVAAYDSLRTAVWTIESLQQFMCDSLLPHEVPLAAPRFKLSEAIRIRELQRHAEYFSLDISAQIVAKLSETEASFFAQSGFPSPSELCRIQRPLYRFEIFCNLFRSLDDPNFGLFQERTNMYLSTFSPASPSWIHGSAVRDERRSLAWAVEAGGAGTTRAGVEPPPRPKLDRGLGKTSQRAANDLRRLLAGKGPTWRMWRPEFLVSRRDTGRNVTRVNEMRKAG